MSELVATPATQGRWVDTNQGRALTDKVLDDLILNYGIEGFFLYLSLPNNPTLDDATEDLLQRICVVRGKQVSFFQHVRTGPHDLWNPADHDGGVDAKHAADHAASIMAPAGAHIGQDLEACHGVTADSDKYCRDWGSACVATSYKARLYVGYSTLMSALQLYLLPDHDSYASDAGHREVAVRGVDTMQGKQVSIDGVNFDYDVVAPDKLGGLFLACAKAPNVIA